MKLRQFIAWAATLPAIIWSVYGGNKSGQCATEEMYHSAAEMKRALARREAEQERDRQRELEYLKWKQEAESRVVMDMEEKYKQATKAVHEEVRKSMNQNIQLRDFVKKHGLWEQWKKERIV